MDEIVAQAVCAQVVAHVRVGGRATIARLCSNSDSSRRGLDILDPAAWKTPLDAPKLVGTRLKEVRFPVGTPVRCYVGDDEWLTGTVVAHNYREPSWPKEQPSAPYQVLLDDEHLAGSERPNAIFAPEDSDELVQLNFRFPLGALAECRVGLDDWCRCTVMGYMYREERWEAGRYAPYQVRIESVLPGSINAEELGKLKGKVIWLTKDNAENIRAISEEREQRLASLLEEKKAGLVGDEEYLDRRRTAIHAAESPPHAPG
eukprot:CAMPEP_0183335896 /NCGR_PEP_ID=MMETSP0164_2-20130417/4040_1 /TAXON_ID=221442 /ORGANISM="Coccolithus pelagicus ssp braarudi, Strain PLY182g" /LENGTH=259 /DNA_ID=CAMNT_0025505325 /DNA_START=1 /DNA_END=781 /DNA_ORIENTATION=+